MPRKLLFFLLPVFLLLSGCHQTTTPSAASPTKTFTIRGKVVSTDATHVTLDHEAIPGFMEAMIMPYKVKDPGTLSELHPGDHIETTNAGLTPILSTHDFVSHSIVTYNLTVDGLHTYYVVAGDTPVLVHNDPGGDLVTVGRWMSPAEYQSMVDTGMVQAGGGGFSYVVYPADQNAYISARPGSVYAEFDVPQSSLIPGGRPGDFKMSDSSTIFSRLSVKNGGPPLELPEAKNIRLAGGAGCP